MTYDIKGEAFKANKNTTCVLRRALFLIPPRDEREIFELPSREWNKVENSRVEDENERWSVIVFFLLRRINKVELRFIFSIEPTFERGRTWKNRINTRVRCWSRGWWKWRAERSEIRKFNGEKYGRGEALDVCCQKTRR